MPRSPRAAALVGCIFLLFALIPLAARGAPAASGAPAPQPLSFIENVGQFDARARFVLHGAGGTLFAADDAIWLSHSRAGRGANIRLSFEGAAHPRVEAFGRLSSRVSFVRGGPERWRANVPVWAGVRYVGLYPRIDLELAGADGRLAPRLVAHAGANLAGVRLRIDGADSIALVDQAIRANSAAGPLALPLLEVVTPAGTPVLPGTSARPALHGREITMPFAASAPAASAPAAQNDGSLIYSTYLGGGGDDFGSAIAVDASGFVYAAGITQSVDFPNTPGAFEPNACGCQDGFVVKFRPGESDFVYASYVGGEGDDEVRGLAVDPRGNVYLTGYTDSDTFPTSPNAFDRKCGSANSCGRGDGVDDAFVMKLSADGSALVYGTYIGGDDFDQAFDIALDAAGAAYITGYTQSADFPRAPNRLRGAADAFAAKLNPAGTDLVYSTYIGGSGVENDDVTYPSLYPDPLTIDATSAIAIDSAGAAYLVGTSDSGDFPVSAGTGAAKDIDTFVVKLAPNGRDRVFSRLYGGAGIDFGKDIALGPGGIYIVGSADDDAQFPAAGTPYDGSFEGGTDAFVLKLNAAGVLAYSTWLGGNSLECVEMCALALGRLGDIFVAGETTSADFPTTQNGYSDTFGGYNDMFVARLSANGQNLLYGSFVGSSNQASEPQDYASALAIDAAGNAYVAGGSNTNVFPTTANALYRHSSGAYDAVVVELATQTTYTVGGVVRDTRGQPVAGVAVRSSAGAVAVTDASGHYRFGSLAAGQYRFQASKLGYSFSPGPIDRAVNADIDDIHFTGISTLAYVPISRKGEAPPPPPTPAPQVCPGDRYDPNENRRALSEKDRIFPGQPIEAKICKAETKFENAKSRQDNYKIRATGTTMKIRLALIPTITSDFDAHLVIYNTSDVNQDICHWSKAAEINSERTCAVTPNGEYIIRIYIADGKIDVNGSYQYNLLVTFP